MALSVASTAQQGDGSGLVRDPRALRNIPAWLNSADSDDESAVSEAIEGTSPPSVAAAPQSLNRPSASDSPLTVASLPASQVLAWAVYLIPLHLFLPLRACWLNLCILIPLSSHGSAVSPPLIAL